MRSVLFISALFALILFSTGCASSQLAAQRELIADQTHELDSLRGVNQHLWTELGILRDSLKFLDDIDSGQYYREQRSLLDRIEKLEYERGVLADGGLTVLTIPSDDLFKPGTAELTPAGKDRLSELSKQLDAAHKKRPIRVEAHTDNVPVGSSMRQRYPTNWELSSARATAIVRQLVEEHDMDAARFQVVAFGDSRPVANNNTQSGRRANRRIRIAAMPE